jgi:hypothetical protein
VTAGRGDNHGPWLDKAWAGHQPASKDGGRLTTDKHRPKQELLDVDLHRSIEFVDCPSQPIWPRRGDARGREAREKEGLLHRNAEELTCRTGPQQHRQNSSPPVCACK